MGSRKLSEKVKRTYIGCFVLYWYNLFKVKVESFLFKCREEMAYIEIFSSELFARNIYGS